MGVASPGLRFVYFAIWMCCAVIIIVARSHHKIKRVHYHVHIRYSANLHHVSNHMDPLVYRERRDSSGHWRVCLQKQLKSDKLKRERNDKPLLDQLKRELKYSCRRRWTESPVHQRDQGNRMVIWAPLPKPRVLVKEPHRRWMTWVEEWDKWNSHRGHVLVSIFEINVYIIHVKAGVSKSK